MEKINKVMKKVLSIFWGMLYSLPLFFMVITYVNGTYRQNVNTNLNYSAYETYMQDVATNNNVVMFNGLFNNYLPNLEKMVMGIQDSNTLPTQANTTNLNSGVEITNKFNTNLIAQTFTNYENATRMATYTTTINANGSIHFDIQQTSYHNSSYTNITITELGLKTFGWSMTNEDYESNKINNGNFYCRMKLLNLTGLGEDMYLNSLRMMFSDSDNSNCGDYAYLYGNANYGNIDAYKQIRNFTLSDNDIVYDPNVFIRNGSIAFKTYNTANSTMHHITFDLVIEFVEMPYLDTQGYYLPNETKTFYSNNEINTIFSQGVQSGITYHTNAQNLITNELIVMNAIINWYVVVSLLHIVIDLILFLPNIIKKAIRKVGVNDAE